MAPEFRYQSGEVVRVERQGEGYQVTINGRVYPVIVERYAPGELTFSINGERYHAQIAHEGGSRWVGLEGETYHLIRSDPTRRRRAVGGGEASLAATMHSQVVQVAVAPGEKVTRGQTLVTLEAMKMELRVTAPHEGTVIKVLCSPGQVVERGQPLVELGAE